MNQAEFNALLDELVSLGEDANEMELWKKVFPNLEASEKKGLIDNLQKERLQLKNLAK